MVKGSKNTEETKNKIRVANKTLGMQKVRNSLLDKDMFDLKREGGERSAKAFIRILNKVVPNITNPTYKAFFQMFLTAYQEHPAACTWNILGSSMVTYSAFYSYCEINPSNIKNLSKKDQDDLIKVKEIINAYLDQRALIYPVNSQYIQFLKTNDQPERFLAFAKTKSISDKLQKEADNENKKGNNSAISTNLSNL